MQDSTPPDTLGRRRFLKHGGLGLAAVLAQLRGAQQVFAEQLFELPDPPSATFGGLRRAYGLDDGVTYLNHASIGTIPLAVQKARRRYLEICETNPWLYIWGEPWQEPLEGVRQQAAAMLHCQPTEIAFNHNTTEAFNLLAQGLPIGQGDEVLFSSLNHSGASICWQHQAETRGFSVRRFDIPIARVPELTDEEILQLYDDAIGQQTRVLVVPHVDNTVGLRHPVRRIAALARQRGVRFVAVDGAQTVGMLPVDLSDLGVDVYATSAHKWLQAPKGLGVLYVRQEIQPELRPMWVTWGQNRWQGSARIYEDYGTRNLAEILTLGDAIRFQQQLGEDARQAHHQRLWLHARTRVEGSAKLTWHSPKQWPQAAALYSVGVADEPASKLFARLFGEHGFVFRPFETLGLNAIRISPNAFNTTAELDRLFDVLES